MAFVEIPLTGTSEGPLSFEIELDAVTYRFSFRYNRRDESWYYDLFDDGDNSLIRSVRSVVNFQLLRTLASRDKPQGLMFFADSRSQPKPPQLDELDKIIFLAYDQIEA